MAECSGWSVLNPLCHAESAAQAVVGSAVENVANAVLEATGKAITSLGTMWVHVGTPNLTGTGGSSSTLRVPVDSGVATAMSYVVWISFALAILALFILGALIASKMRAGDGVAAVGKVGLILSAVVLISAASGIVGMVLPNEPRGVGGAVEFIQAQLWWYMGAAAVLSVIVGGARMAWEQRAEPGKDLVKSLLTLVVVAGAGVTIIGLLITAADRLAVTIINNSLSCDVATDSACFGQNIAVLLALSSVPGGPGLGLGPFLMIVLGLVALIASLFQIVLMIARGGMLVILAGILPLSASFTNTEMGRGWFKKAIAWTVALILYKPAAAIVYAAAFQLVGTKTFNDDGSGLLAVLTGLMLMMIALFAMPALMKFVTPLVGSLAAGAGGAMAVGALASLPSGAASLGRLASGSGEAGGSGESGAAGPSGPGAGSQPGQKGSDGGTPSGGGEGGDPNTPREAPAAGGAPGADGGSKQGVPAGGESPDVAPGGAGGGEGSPGGEGTPGAGGSPEGGSDGGPESGGPGVAAGTPSPAPGGAASGAAGGGGGAAAIAAEGGGSAAAAGPAGAALAAGKAAADGVVETTQEIANDATGEGGPDGSN